MPSACAQISGLQPAAAALVRHGGSQCGYCTAGAAIILDDAASARRACSNASAVADVEECLLDGLLCRCTGYRGLLEAARELFSETEAPATQPQPQRPAGPWTGGCRLQSAEELLASWRRENVRLCAGGTSLGVLRALGGGGVSRGPCTELLEQVERRLTDEQDASARCSLLRTAGELRSCELLHDEEMRVGGAVTLTEWMGALRSGSHGWWCAAVADHLRRVANPAVRNAATLGGNLHLFAGVLCQPARSDLIVLLITLRARVRVRQRHDARLRTVSLSDYCHEAATDERTPLERYVAPRLLIESVLVPLRWPDPAATSPPRLWTRRLSSRGVNNTAEAVAASVCCGDGESSVAAAPVVVALRSRPQLLLVSSVEDQVARGLDACSRRLLGGLLAQRRSFASTATVTPPSPPSNLERAVGVRAAPGVPNERWRPRLDAHLQASGRCTYSGDLAVVHAAGTLHGAPVLSSRARSLFLGVNTERAVRAVAGARFLGAADVPGENSAFPVSDLCAADEPLFLPVGERTSFVGQWLGVMVARSAAEARRAARLVHVLYRSVNDDDQRTMEKHDESSAGQDEKRTAVHKANTLTEDKEEQDANATAIDGKGHRDGDERSAVLSVEEAEERGSFLASQSGGVSLMPPVRTCTPAELQAELARCEVVASGEVHTAAQAHFHLESQVAVACPEDGGQRLRVYSSTQDPRGVQCSVASALGLRAAAVEVEAIRLGGDFGGKGPRSLPVAVAAAVIAAVCGRAACLQVDRQTELLSQGRRHGMRARYTCGGDRDGRVRALQVDLLLDGGSSTDTSLLVANVALMNADAAYYVSHFEVGARVARTNLPTSTAMRGFGQPQATFATEVALCAFAAKAGLAPEEVRTRNLFGAASGTDVTPYGQRLADGGCTLCTTWRTLLRESEFAERRAAVDRWNAEERARQSGRWRGLAAVPLKYGVGYVPPALNQAAACVHALYADGSLVISHGGVEMGQGIGTKLAAVAAEVLGVLGMRAEDVRVAPTSTATVANALPSGASVACDLNARAVASACHQLRERLMPLCGPDYRPSYEAWCSLLSRAFFAQVHLSAISLGLYDERADRFDESHSGPAAAPLRWDWRTCRGSPYRYFTYGAAAAEVEVDVNTGEVELLRVDALCDAGDSLNPALDIGQVEGAFVQGFGLFMSENPDAPEQRGSALCYSVPGVRNVAHQLNVRLLSPAERAPSGEEGHRRSYSGQRAKSVGEPPLSLACSVYFAAVDAIRAARQRSGEDASEFVMPSVPLTASAVRDLVPI